MARIPVEHSSSDAPTLAACEPKKHHGRKDRDDDDD